MKKIPLTQGQCAIVDDEDFEKLNQFKWHADWTPSTKSFYARRAIRLPNGKQTTEKMHRAIMGDPRSENGRAIQIDHRNHDTLDNRKENMRLATTSENMMNRGRQANNSSGYKGVSFHKRLGKWIATIGVKGKLNHLGYYATPKAAAHAYNQAALKHHGEYAVLNEIKTL